MKKRTIKFGAYDTAAHGWTLAELFLTDPEVKENYTEKTGADGSWDWTTILSDGIPRYRDRYLTVALECSEGDREHRERLISELVNLLDGLVWDIVPPDHPHHYLVGRLHVAVEYSDLAHCRVVVTGTCEPWFYSAREKMVHLESLATVQFYHLHNEGRRVVAPVFNASSPIQVSLAPLDESSPLVVADLLPGVHTYPDLVLRPGRHKLTYIGAGSLTITYREAVLR